MSSGGAAGGAGAAAAGSAGAAGAGGGGGNANANQAQLRLARGSSKPPKFEGTFEVYRVELELYLEEREAWGVVIGTDQRHNNNADQQAIWDSRNRLARGTILRGLRGCQDNAANKVCAMATAREMWTSLVEDNTARDYSYMMTLRSQLYALKHVQGQPMTEYLANMGRTRQLLNIVDPTHAISDDEMARILVMGVMQTHRDLVDQFDVPTRQGNPPNLQQVTNALRSRDERDHITENGVGSTLNGGAAVMSVTRTEPQQQGSDSTGNGGAWKKKRKCFHCGKIGHIKRECWGFLNKQKKPKENQKETKKSGKCSGWRLESPTTTTLYG